MNEAFLIKPTVSVFVEQEEDNTILMVQQNNPLFLGRWGQPGGHVKPGESPADAAVRETKEETGYDIRIDANANFATYVCPERSNAPYFINFCFKGTLKKHVRSPVEDPEILEAKWFSLGDLKKFPMEQYRSALTHRRTTEWLHGRYLHRGFIVLSPEELG